MKYSKSWTILIVLIFGFILVASNTCQAHREDYIDETLVYQTLEKGEVEPEYLVDFGDRPAPERGFTRHGFALEYGITEQFMVDGRVSFESELESALVEFRYRFSEEGQSLIDFAFSGEFNMERSGNGSDRYGIEPRFILSKDFDHLNLTLNLPVEIPFESSPVEFIPALGWRYDIGEFFKFGTELKYNTHEEEGSVIPQIWFSFPLDITVKFGYSHGFDRNKEKFVRSVLEMEF